MKTQQYTQRLFKAITLAMIIALISPTAGAQERRNSDNNRRGQQIETQNKRSKTQLAQTNNDHKKDKHAYKKQNYHTSTYYNKHKLHHKKYKHQDPYRREHKHPRVHVKTNPHAYHHWDVHHKPHISYRKLPHRAFHVYLNGENYFVHNGRFYMHSPWGYYKVKAPKYVNTLPRGVHVHWVQGQQLYNYKGILFISTHKGYKLIAS